MLDLLVVKHIDGFFIPRKVRGSPFSVRIAYRRMYFSSPSSSKSRGFRVKALRYLDDDFQGQEMDDVPNSIGQYSQDFAALFITTSGLSRFYRC
jgi:hypothetical protein